MRTQAPPFLGGKWLLSTESQPPYLKDQLFRDGLQDHPQPWEGWLDFHSGSGITCPSRRTLGERKPSHCWCGVCHNLPQLLWAVFTTKEAWLCEALQAVKSQQPIHLCWAMGGGVVWGRKKVVRKEGSKYIRILWRVKGYLISSFPLHIGLSYWKKKSQKLCRCRK